MKYFLMILMFVAMPLSADEGSALEKKLTDLKKQLRDLGFSEEEIKGTVEYARKKNTPRNPKSDKKLAGVVRYYEVNGRKLPQFDEIDFEGLTRDKEMLAVALTTFYDGWTYEDLEKTFGKPKVFKRFGEYTNKWLEAQRDHMVLWNKATDKSRGFVMFLLDRKTNKVLYVQAAWGNTLAQYGGWHPTPTAKKLGYTKDRFVPKDF